MLDFKIPKCQFTKCLITNAPCPIGKLKVYLENSKIDHYDWFAKRDRREPKDQVGHKTFGLKKTPRARLDKNKPEKMTRPLALLESGNPTRNSEKLEF